MKPSSIVIFLLALYLFLSGSQCIRLDKGLKLTRYQFIQERIAVKTATNYDNNMRDVSNEGAHSSSSSAGTRKSRTTRSTVAKLTAKTESQHWFPWIPEDYHGPRRHKPKHN